MTKNEITVKSSGKEQNPSNIVLESIESTESDDVLLKIYTFLLDENT